MRDFRSDLVETSVIVTKNYYHYYYYNNYYYLHRKVELTVYPKQEAA